MKKIFAIVMALALSMTAFAACNKQSDDSQSHSCDSSSSADSSGNSVGSVGKVPHESETEEGIVLYAHYDYGMHISNYATLLLSYNSVFFKLADYGIENLIAGDIVTVQYEGMFIVSEIYPGDVSTNDMTIIDVSVQEAKILELEVWQVPGGGYDIVYNGGTVACENPYVIYEDGTFEVLGQKHVGMTLWGSDNPENSSINIQALYAYNPRPTNTNTKTPPAEHVHSLVCLEEVEPTCLYEGSFG